MGVSTWASAGDGSACYFRKGNRFVLSFLFAHASVPLSTLFLPHSYFQVVRQKVPLELEKGEMPLNTFNNKAPFKVN